MSASEPSTERVADVDVELRYRTTETAIQEFEAALAGLDASAKDRPDRMREVMRDAINSQLADLRDELADLAAMRATSGATATTVTSQQQQRRNA